MESEGRSTKNHKHRSTQTQITSHMQRSTVHTDYPYDYVVTMTAAHGRISINEAKDGKSKPYKHLRTTHKGTKIFHRNIRPYFRWKSSTFGRNHVTALAVPAMFQSPSPVHRSKDMFA